MHSVANPPYAWPVSLLPRLPLAAHLLVLSPKDRDTTHQLWDLDILRHC